MPGAMPRSSIVGCSCVVNAAGTCEATPCVAVTARPPTADVVAAAVFGSSGALVRPMRAAAADMSFEPDMSFTAGGIYGTAGC